MNLQKTLNRWKINVKKYFLSYKDGFFHIYMLVNSPELIIKNFSNMPFVKHDKKRQIISTENPFLKVNIFYAHIENGLTIMVTDAFYKKNVIDHMLYDDELPTEHYFISIKVSNCKVKDSFQLINGTAFSTNIWSISKPKSINEVCHFKNSHEQYFIIYFTKQWIENYLFTCKVETRCFLQNFLESTNSFVLWPQTSNISEVYKKFLDEALEKGKMEYSKDELHTFALQLLNDLTECVTTKTDSSAHFSMSNEQRLKILMVEGLLAEYYLNVFPGVDFLAKKVGVSSTGLKTGFMNLFGCSVYKYYRQKK